MGFGDFIVHFWGESPLQFLSLCCQLHVHKKTKKKSKILHVLKQSSLHHVAPS